MVAAHDVKRQILAVAPIALSMEERRPAHRDYPSEQVGMPQAEVIRHDPALTQPGEKDAVGIYAKAPPDIAQDIEDVTIFLDAETIILLVISPSRPPFRRHEDVAMLTGVFAPPPNHVAGAVDIVVQHYQDGISPAMMVFGRK